MKIINLHEYSDKIPLPTAKWTKKNHEAYLKLIDRTSPIFPNIRKHYYNSVKKNAHPDIFLSELPKVRNEIKYELFYIYCIWWHYFNCRKSRYKNCNELWTVKLCQKAEPDYFRMIKMFYYEINKPKVIKCAGRAT